MATWQRDDSDLSVLTGVASTTVGNLRFTGSTIGLESDTDILTFSSNALDITATSGLSLKNSDILLKNSGDTTTISLDASTGIITATSITSTSTLSTTGNVTIGGTLDVAGASINLGSNSYMTLTDNEIDVSSGDLTIDVAGNILLDAGGAEIKFLAGGTAYLEWTAAGALKFNSFGDADDYFQIHTSINGAVTLSNYNDSGAAAGMVFDSTGAVTFDSANNQMRWKDNGTLYGQIVNSSTQMQIQSGSSPTAAITCTDANVKVEGELTIGSVVAITSDTNKFLVSDSGVVKYVTGDTLIPDILTAGTNCTLSGSTLNVDDAFIKNDANDTMAGTLAITSTTADQFKVLYDASNYALLNVSATGDLEIETIGAGSTDSDITLNADGDIVFEAAGGNITSDAPLEILSTSTQLKLTHNANDYATFAVADTGDLTIATVGDGSYDSDLILNADGDLNITAVSNVNIAASYVEVSLGGTSASLPQFTLKSYATGLGIASGPILNLTNQTGDPAADAADDQIVGQIRFNSYDDGTPSTQVYAQIDSVTADVSSGAEQGKMNLKVATYDGSTVSGLEVFGTNQDGLVTVHNPNGHLGVLGGNKVVFDMDTTGAIGAGLGYTYITESSDDILDFYVGTQNMLKLSENGTDGNQANFADASVGFPRIEATFSNSNTGSGVAGVIGIIDSGGTDDTDIDFRFCNKFRLEMTGDIAQMNLIFPAMSGNFLLVCTTNGDHDVTAWKAWESDESAATTTDVMWAGGSVPAFTSSGVDIVSFYWDANEQECYGTASLAFATP